MKQQDISPIHVGYGAHYERGAYYYMYNDSLGVISSRDFSDALSRFAQEARLSGAAFVIAKEKVVRFINSNVRVLQRDLKGCTNREYSADLRRWITEEKEQRSQVKALVFS